MLQQTRASLARRSAGRVFYGWMMVLAVGLGIFASRPGQSHNSSVFIGPISHDLGISITSIALAYALATMRAAFRLPYVGKQVDRFGPRLGLLGLTVLLLRMLPSIGDAENWGRLYPSFAGGSGITPRLPALI